MYISFMYDLNSDVSAVRAVIGIGVMIMLLLWGVIAMLKNVIIALQDIRIEIRELKKRGNELDLY